MGSTPGPDAWDIVYFRNATGGCPADDFLDSCPAKVSAQLIAVLDDVAQAPPPRYSGGGRWEAMHGAMRGFYEVRAQGPRREQFRLFCVLENGTAPELARRGPSRPAIAVIAGLRKPWMTTFSERDYESVRRLGEDHRGQFPRRIKTLRKWEERGILRAVHLPGSGFRRIPSSEIERIRAEMWRDLPTEAHPGQAPRNVPRGIVADDGFGELP